MPWDGAEGATTLSASRRAPLRPFAVAFVRSAALACLALAMSGIAAADGPRGAGGRGDRYLDTRYHHDRYYPPRGYAAPHPPPGAAVVRYYDRSYWYGGGVWYAPRGAGVVVVGPPVGAFVSVLPGFHTTVWFGGMPYYYANEAYYVWREPRRAYEVVEPPRDAAPATEPPAPDEIYIYPRNGQDAERQAKDRYECHRWAADQTGFDPTRPEGGVAAELAAAKRADYFRAMTACLEGRGYSVR
jgi:hypothetical protein